MSKEQMTSPQKRIRRTRSKMREPIYQAQDEPEVRCPKCKGTNIDINGFSSYFCYDCNIEFDEDCAYDPTGEIDGD